MSPRELWELAAAGDHEAFAQIYRRHSNKVFLHCRIRLSSVGDAEDLTAEVFAAAWRHRSSITAHETADVLPWLLAAANNLLRKHYRQHRRHSRMLSRLEPGCVEPDVAAQVLDADDAERSARMVLAALDLLRSRDREIIELRFVHDMPLTAIADTLHVPPSTARSRLQRALIRARRTFTLLQHDLATSAKFGGRHV